MNVYPAASCRIALGLILALGLAFPALAQEDCDLTNYEEHCLSGGFVDCDSLWLGPLQIQDDGVSIEDIILELRISHTRVGDLKVLLYYDVSCDGTPDVGPVAALCRPALDGCPSDDCCGCGSDIDGSYFFSDDASTPLGEYLCPTMIPEGCYAPAVESENPFSVFEGLPKGGCFYLKVVDGACDHPTDLAEWCVWSLTSPPAGNQYAVLICGDTPFTAREAYMNGTGAWGPGPDRDMDRSFDEFWNDIDWLYNILIERADFTPDRIFVLCGNGTDWPVLHPNQVCCRYFPKYGTVTDFAATLQNVRMVFDGLEAGDPEHGIPQMTENDDLYVYTFDHGYTGGGSDGAQYGDSYLCLMDGMISDVEFADRMDQIPYARRTVFMQQCFSGGFIDNLTEGPHDAKTCIFTACRGNQSAYPADNDDPYPDNHESGICELCGLWVTHGEFNYYFMSAHNWASPIGTEIDPNIYEPDNEISSYEAGQWALVHDSQSEDPQFRDVAGIGHSWISTLRSAADVWDGTDGPGRAFLRLAQNRPNPFGLNTQIEYVLPVAARVKLEVYNPRGQRVVTLINGHQSAGVRTIRWDGKDLNGTDVSSGIYFYKLQTGHLAEVRRMLLVR